MCGVELSEGQRGAEPQRQAPVAAAVRDLHRRPDAPRPAPIAAGLFGLITAR